jgi:hypothetical protein
MFTQCILYILKGYENIWILLNIVSHWVSVPVVHIIIKFCLRYNNITIIYLPYAIYFSTFKNTVFMFITCEFDFQNDFMCIIISLDQYSFIIAFW